MCLNKCTDTCIPGLFIVSECVKVGGFQGNMQGKKLHVIMRVLMHLFLYLLGTHLAFESQLGGFEAYCKHPSVCVFVCMLIFQ